MNIVYGILSIVLATCVTTLVLTILEFKEVFDDARHNSNHSGL